MKRLIPICTISFLLLLPQIGKAATSTVTDPGQRFLEEQKRQRDEQLMEKPPAQVEVPSLPTPEVTDKKETCFQIDIITLKGATLLPMKQQMLLFAPYVHLCIGLKEINNLIHDITNRYIAMGYVTTRAYIPPQNLQSKTLELVIVEGKVESLQMNHPEALKDKAQLASAFPSVKGSILNLKDIEQGLDQINRLPSNNATMKIWPGDTSGDSRVVIDNTPQDALRSTVAYDNYGQKNTGIRRVHAGIEKDNLIGINDTFSFNYIGSLDTNALAMSASVPYGYWTFSYDGSYSEYLSIIDDSSELFGRSYNHNLTVNRVVYRGQENKLSLEGIVNVKDSTRLINDALLSPQPLTVGRIGIIDNLRTENAVWNFDAHYSEGFAALGAISDAPGLASDSPRAEFKKIDGGITLYKPLSFANLRSTIRGQYSLDSLYSSEQISIGDNSTVRGYTGSVASGDSGLYNQNELSFTLPTTFAAIIPFGLGKDIVPYSYIDGGYTKLKTAHEYTYLTGAGVGIRFNSKRFSSDVSFALPLTASNSVERDAYVFYFTVSYKLL